MSATRLASAATLATFGLGLAAADPLAAFRPASFGSPEPEAPWSLPPPTVTPASPPSPAPALPPASPPSTVAVAFSARDDLDYVPLYGLDDRDDVARDRLYASAVRDATDALEAALLDDNLGPDDVRRDAALRLVLGDLREEIDRLLPPADFPVRPVRDARLLRGEPLLVAGNPRDTPAALLGRSLADPSPLNPSLLRAAPVARARAVRRAGSGWRVHAIAHVALLHPSRGQPPFRGRLAPVLDPPATVHRLRDVATVHVRTEGDVVPRAKEPR